MHVLLSPLSLTASIENNNCQVEDNNGRLRYSKKERKKEEERKKRKRRRNYTQEETAKAESGEIGSNVANGSRMLGERR